MSFPRYPDYKDSGVEWLGEVPGHWAVLPIKRIVSIPVTDGPHETPQFVVDGVPFVSAEAVSSGRIDFSKIRACITAEDNARYSQKYFPKRHDIYMVKSGATTGITAIVEDRTDFNIWSPLAVVRCGEKAVPHFVLNFMRSQNFLEAVTLNWSFGTQQNIGMGVIENLFCTLPPLPEQTQIAAFLDRETAKIDALVAEQRRLMELLKEKRQAVISHAVTRGLNPHAPMKPSGIEWLGDVPEHWATPAMYMRYSSELGKMLDSAKITGNHLIPYMRNVDVQWGAINFEDLPSMDIHENDYERYIVKSGDLLVCEGGEVGRAAIVPQVSGIFGYQKALHRLRALDASEDSRFMYFTLLWAANTGIFDQSGSSTIAHLTGEQLRKYRFPKPPIQEQNAIASFLEAESAEFDALTTEAQRAIDLLQERRSALISAAVTGQIDVRGAV